MPKITRELIALCWIVFVTGFVLASCVYMTGIWPSPILKKIEDYVKGHPEERTTLTGKIANDLNIKPSRHIVVFPGDSTNASSYKDLTGLPLNPRRNKPKILLSEKVPLGYRLIYGVFDFNETLHGAVLLDEKGEVANVWQISQEDVDWNHSPDRLVFPHGFEIAPDGSIFTAYDGGTSLIRYDYCYHKIWRLIKIMPVQFQKNGCRSVSVLLTIDPSHCKGKG